jgi:hypothetical protein
MKSSTATKAPDTEDLKKLVPSEYHSFMGLLGKPLLQQLLTHCFFNHQLKIKKGKKVPFGPIYHLLEKEPGALREYLDRILT